MGQNSEGPSTHKFSKIFYCSLSNLIMSYGPMIGKIVTVVILYPTAAHYDPYPDLRTADYKLNSTVDILLSQSKPDLKSV